MTGYSHSPMNSGPSTENRHRVVIIGSGFGGLAAARALEKADVDVTLVARTGHHLFQPLLYQVATGILSVGEIAPSTRLVLRDQKNVTVAMGEVDQIDVTARRLHATAGHVDFELEYDSLIVAAGANQSYFGNDHFEHWAPGMKSIDDALELRSRIMGCFEQAEVTDDEEERRRLLTFVVVGAGPTGVEMAGQIAELARRTLKNSFRRIDPARTRVILLDAAPAVLPPFGNKLGNAARSRLEEIGVEIQLNAMVTDVDYYGIEVKDPDGSRRRIDATCKIWSAGVQASPLGRMLAEQTGAEVDRAGRVLVNKDLSLPGRPEIFVIGDMINLDNLPGVSPVAIQGGKYVAKQIAREVATGRSPAARRPFKYFDKGSMATVSRYSAVAKIGPFQLQGFIAWVLWLVVHLAFLIGFRNRVITLLSWGLHMGDHRSHLNSTARWAYGRQALARAEQVAERDTERAPAD
ncbi:MULTISPECIES: NAD(P)/FAD-dependent oxidoreductase [Dietzia]|uniref:NADH:ubiquinone reductase (non-electrogenic) n=1 Tax=Dietzia cinnamea TaxID=321318 RepID=A0AAW5QAW6_9ACTN|nr:MULTISPECIES: NAD(P)/FAD-dependent oxidoreductase [Dietzia]MBM7232120.1 NAD(P)/FAD-dependent oxidoreductase [Dietzia cinnamea]MCT1865881.1 NAD(P)/FAD-dependent oxidoreductase [Dietzia cinnamea]MCT2031882.1 NAD(P)/FAD-dependent oxidoreductase [Dietzia cinnamea]MCT2035256.1 NAD(P)/FAD-dependent oxidoreductase [Dietzia cinnamea]MCT2062335.1 NAD(P)/FAD-dependent oxidoreductase [Dietzia cinnamea]